MEDREIYRKYIKGGLSQRFQVTSLETNLFIQCGNSNKDLKKEATESVIKYRGYISAFIESNPLFLKSLEPLAINKPSPEIVRDMMEASKKADVGPMASVAGIISEYTGRDILKYTDEVIVENGGDIFLKVKKPLTMAVYAGKSPLSMKIGLKIDRLNPFSICTSSGSIGHSLSFGKTDAVTVISEECALADAAATSIGNMVKKHDDIEKAISFGKNIEGVQGIIIIMDSKMGAWGDVNLIKL